MKLRTIETWLRRKRVAFFKMLAGTRRGRKLLLDFLPSNIKEVTVDCGDHRICVVPHEMIGRHVIATGSYTRDSVDKVLRELDQRNLIPASGCSALEIGANIGTHTLYLALTQRFEQIIAVEPDPRNLPLLQRNVVLNALEDRVQIVECAAGEEEGQLMLNRVEGNYGNSSLVHTHRSGDTVAVPVKPVDIILRDAGTDPATIALVWMDIEGFEPQACRSMQTLLTRQVPLYMEFSPEFYEREGTIAFVQYLQQYYNHCIVMRHGKSEAAAVEDLASLDRQCDVLFLPG